MAVNQKGFWNDDNQDRNADTIANLEQGACHAPLAKKKTQRHDSPCHIAIHSLRHRLADIDGICAKAAIDGLVHSGILDDDSPQYVKSVSFSQEKTKVREETRITIEWDD